MDRENSCEGMQLFAPKTKQINLIFSGSPVPASAKAVLDNYPGKSAAVRLSCSLPYHRHYSPPPINCPDGFVPPGLSSGSATSAVINGAGPDGCLPELDMFPPVAKLCVYGICALCGGVFSLFSHCTPQWSIVWGLKKKFSPPFPHVML